MRKVIVIITSIGPIFDAVRIAVKYENGQKYWFGMLPAYNRIPVNDTVTVAHGDKQVWYVTLLFNMLLLVFKIKPEIQRHGFRLKNGQI